MPLAEKGVRGKGRQPLSPPSAEETLWRRLQETNHNLIGFGRVTVGVLLEELRGSSSAAQPRWLRRSMWEQNP